MAPGLGIQQYLWPATVGSVPNTYSLEFVTASNEGLKVLDSAQTGLDPASGTFTFECGIDWTGTPSIGTFEVILSKYDPGTNDRGYLISMQRTAGANFQWIARMSENGITTDGIAWNKSTLAAGWTHNAFVFNTAETGAAKVKWYVDGSLQGGASHAEVANISSIRNTAADWYLGINFQTGFGLNSGMAATVDEVRQWQDVRLAAEIDANKAKHIAGDAADLELYLRLNDGTGTTATDETANNNDAAFVGTPVWTAAPDVLFA